LVAQRNGLIKSNTYGSRTGYWCLICEDEELQRILLQMHYQPTLDTLKNLGKGTIQLSITFTKV